MTGLSVNLILEILGRPKEHIESALKSLVERLGSEKGIKITSKTIHDAVPVPDTKDLFTSFAEISADLDSLSNYFGVIFAYMPSHIEIVTPENLDVSNSNLNEIGNKLLQRLHDYDAITKKALTEREIFANKLREVAPHLFKQNPPQNQEPPKETKPKKKSKKSSK